MDDVGVRTVSDLSKRVRDDSELDLVMCDVNDFVAVPLEHLLLVEIELLNGRVFDSRACVTVPLRELADSELLNGRVFDSCDFVAVTSDEALADIELLNGIVMDSCDLVTVKSDEVLAETERGNLEECDGETVTAAVRLLVILGNSSTASVA